MSEEPKTTRGPAFLLKLGGDGKYSTVAGLQTKCLSINGEPTDAKQPKNGWRELLSGQAARSVTISATGIFTGSAAERSIRSNALNGSIDDYEMSFESGEQIRGRFMVTRLEYAGDYNGERNYTIALDSSGEITAHDHA